MQITLNLLETEYNAILMLSPMLLTPLQEMSLSVGVNLMI